MQHNRKIIYLTGFLFSIPIALVTYINSSFLENYVGKNYVGIIYILASLVTIAGLLEMPRVLNRLGNKKTLSLFCALIFISFVALATLRNVFLAIPFFILYFSSVGFVIASLDIFVKDCSKNFSVGKFRGLYLLAINSAWMVAQMISGTVINKISFTGIYLLGALCIALALLVFNLFLKSFEDPKYNKISIPKTVKVFIQNKNISKIYLSNLVLQLFYAFMVIYSPIYLHEYMGFGWDKIGLIFGIMLIPFVLLDFPLGKLSDKIGEKKMLVVGFFITTIAVLIIPFIRESVFWMWAAILFGTRVGAASIEVMNDSYFFKIVQEEDADEISFFRNASSVSYVIAPLIALPLLFILPHLKYLFFVLSVILLIGLFNALKLKDIK